jgi:hypothetical protein
MKFTVGRLDIVAVQTLAPPLFGLPARAPELFEALYSELNEQFPMRPADLQVTGGTAYSDIKVTVKSGDKLEADIGANGFYAHMLDVGDKEHFKKLVSTYETTLQSFFPRIAFVDSLLRLKGWLECEGGTEAVEATLQARGEQVFGLKSFGGFLKDYTFRTELRRPDETWSVSMLLQRSALPAGHLYAEANFNFYKGYSEKRLAPQLDMALEQSLRLLKDAGFEGETE